MKEGGGGALMHVYVWEYIVSLYYRTAWWMFTKLGRDEVLMVPHLCLGFSANPAQGWIQGGAKIGQWGSLLQRTSSSDWKATAINRMHGSDLKAYGKKPCYFWFHFEVKYLTRFWRLFGLSHLVYLNAISIDLYVVKSLSAFILCNCHVYRWKNAYIKHLLYAWKILMKFFMYLFRWRKGGGHLCMYMYGNTYPFLQNRLMDVDQTW